MKETYNFECERTSFPIETWKEEPKANGTKGIS